MFLATFKIVFKIALALPISAASSKALPKSSSKASPSASAAAPTTPAHAAVPATTKLKAPAPAPATKAAAPAPTTPAPVATPPAATPPAADAPVPAVAPAPETKPVKAPAPALAKKKKPSSPSSKDKMTKGASSQKHPAPPPSTRATAPPYCIDIEWTTTGTGDADTDGSSTQTTRNTSYDNFRPHNTPDSSEPNWISEQQQSFNLDIPDICDRLTSSVACEEILYCEEVKNQDVSEIDVLFDEIRPTVEEHKRDSQDSVSTSLAEKWIEASCRKYKAEFDLYAAILKNVASTPLRSKDDVAPRVQNGLKWVPPPLSSNRSPERENESTFAAGRRRIVEVVTESLTLKETSIPTKVA
eukprot:XP_023156848.1 cyclin-dependent kinase inhibitor 1C-like [Zea mays]